VPALAAAAERVAMRPLKGAALALREFMGVGVIDVDEVGIVLCLCVFLLENWVMSSKGTAEKAKNFV
jgi:hypothetical protein